MIPFRLSLVSVLSFTLATVAALRFPLRREEPNTHYDTNGDVYDFGVVNGGGDPLTVYVATLYAEDRPFKVILDTGSSDLWLDTAGIPFNRSQDTGKEATTVYVDRTVAGGPIWVTDMKFGNLKVTKQAFTSSPNSNATTPASQGLLGLGFPALSKIVTSLNNTSYGSDPLLLNIFRSNLTIPNFFTVFLNRTGIGAGDGGIFTIGEVEPEYRAVLDAPKLLTLPYAWVTAVSGLRVDGKLYTGHGITGFSQGQSKTLALLDTGDSTVRAPPYYVDLLYKNLPGARLSNKEDGTYTIPCDTKLNVSVSLNGTDYPINPLDLITVASNEDGKTICQNLWIYNSNSEDSDWTLGGPFLRNVYSLFSFGDSRTEIINPHMQVLGVTNHSKAWAEFEEVMQARIKEHDKLFGPGSNNASTSIDPKLALNAASSTTEHSTDRDYTALLRNSYIIIGLLTGTVVLLVVSLVSNVCSKGESSGRGRYKAVGRKEKVCLVDLIDEKPRSYDDPYNP